jgi:PhzF family phenazine biosynthesis protein
MNILRIAAFSYKGEGGNPAGVVFCDKMPEAVEMLEIAKQVGYSETAFLLPQEDGWRIRYFAPEMEVPFCGHATIACGAALGEQFGEGKYKLFLNQGEISISAEKSSNNVFTATLQSPETWSKAAPRIYVDKVLAAFNLGKDSLDPDFPIRFAFAGAKHLIVAVKDRKTLADMCYPFDSVKSLMADEDLVTINLIWHESHGVFHSRNAFASGGVYEDPATGAAAAALAGYLRDIHWQGEKAFKILQGEDMGMPSRLFVRYGSKIGESISVSGETRHIIDNP